jgi:hypothetical protein
MNQFTPIVMPERQRFYPFDLMAARKISSCYIEQYVDSIGRYHHGTYAYKHSITIDVMTVAIFKVKRKLQN